MPAVSLTSQSKRYRAPDTEQELVSPPSGKARHRSPPRRSVRPGHNTLNESDGEDCGSEHESGYVDQLVQENYSDETERCGIENVMPISKAIAEIRNSTGVSSRRGNSGDSSGDRSSSSSTSTSTSSTSSSEIVDKNNNGSSISKIHEIDSQMQGGTGVVASYIRRFRTADPAPAHERNAGNERSRQSEERAFWWKAPKETKVVTSEKCDTDISRSEHIHDNEIISLQVERDVGIEQGESPPRTLRRLRAMIQRRGSNGNENVHLKRQHVNQNIDGADSSIISSKSRMSDKYDHRNASSSDIRSVPSSTLISSADSAKTLHVDAESSNYSDDRNKLLSEVPTLTGRMSDDRNCGYRDPDQVKDRGPSSDEDDDGVDEYEQEELENVDEKHGNKSHPEGCCDRFNFVTNDCDTIDCVQNSTIARDWRRKYPLKLNGTSTRKLDVQSSSASTSSTIATDYKEIFDSEELDVRASVLLRQCDKLLHGQHGMVVKHSHQISAVSNTCPASASPTATSMIGRASINENQLEHQNSQRRELAVISDEKVLSTSPWSVQEFLCDDVIEHIEHVRHGVAHISLEDGQQIRDSIVHKRDNSEGDKPLSVGHIDNENIPYPQDDYNKSDPKRSKYRPAEIKSPMPLSAVASVAGVAAMALADTGIKSLHIINSDSSAATPLASSRASTSTFEPMPTIHHLKSHESNTRHRPSYPLKNAKKSELDIQTNNNSDSDPCLLVSNENSGREKTHFFSGHPNVSATDCETMSAKLDESNRKTSASSSSFAISLSPKSGTLSPPNNSMNTKEAVRRIPSSAMAQLIQQPTVYQHEDYTGALSVLQATVTGILWGSRFSYIEESGLPNHTLNISSLPMYSCHAAAPTEAGPTSATKRERARENSALRNQSGAYVDQNYDDEEELGHHDKRHDGNRNLRSTRTIMNIYSGGGYTSSEVQTNELPREVTDSFSMQSEDLRMEKLKNNEASICSSNKQASIPKEENGARVSDVSGKLEEIDELEDGDLGDDPEVSLARLLLHEKGTPITSLARGITSTAATAITTTTTTDNVDKCYSSIATPKLGTEVLASNDSDKQDWKIDHLQYTHDVGRNLDSMIKDSTAQVTVPSTSIGASTIFVSSPSDVNLIVSAPATFSLHVDDTRNNAIDNTAIKTDMPDKESAIDGTASEADRGSMDISPIKQRPCDRKNISDHTSPVVKEALNSGDPCGDDRVDERSTKIISKAVTGPSRRERERDDDDSASWSDIPKPSPKNHKGASKVTTSSSSHIENERNKNSNDSSASSQETVLTYEGGTTVLEMRDDTEHRQSAADSSDVSHEATSALRRRAFALQQELQRRRHNKKQQEGDNKPPDV